MALSNQKKENTGKLHFLISFDSTIGFVDIIISIPLFRLVHTSSL